MSAQISIVMGSDSDLPVMQEAAVFLREMEIPFEVVITSAHRTPGDTESFASGAAARGVKVIIAGAGGAAHLPGVIAAYTNLPVVGVPIRTSALGGADSLYSIVQMPKGVPVACMAINGAKNAAIFAAQMLALESGQVRKKLEQFKAKMASQVREKNRLLGRVGIEKYLQEKDGSSTT